MYVLNAEKRDSAVKAKKLRRDGLVTGSVHGGDLEETLLIQVPEREAKRLLKTKGKGGIVSLVCNGNQYSVMLSKVQHDPLKNQIQDIYFQKLVAAETVNGTAQVILKNKDKVQTMVHLLMEEIPYKALPEHLIEEIEIDLGTLPAGTSLTLKELPIWQEKNIELLTDGEQLVLTIAIA